MVTVEDLLASAEADMFNSADDLIHIDPVTRQLLIPESELVLGVEGDEKAESKFFSIPKVVGNNVDVTQCSIKINFENARGERDFYVVKDIAVNDTTVVFRWELSRTATRYAGDTYFSIYLCKTTNGVIDNEWHTERTPGRVLEGLDVEVAAEESLRPDVLAEITEAAIVAAEAAARAEYAAGIANGGGAINLTDSITGKSYSLSVVDGKLTMTESEVTE